jgi:hypothetical protein
MTIFQNEPYLEMKLAISSLGAAAGANCSNYI